MIVPVLCLSTALIAGCSQGTQPAGSTESAGSATQGSAPAAAAEQTPQAELTAWQDKTFYERPVADIASDLELLDFEITADNYYEEEQSGYRYCETTFSGQPADNPFEGSDPTVNITVTVEDPVFVDGAEDLGYETLAEGTLPTGYTVWLSYTERDPSEYEAVARQVADTLGLGAFTESTVGPSPFDETRILGNFSADDTYFGTPTTHLISMTVYPDNMTLNPDAPLSVTFGLWNVQAME